MIPSTIYKDKAYPAEDLCFNNAKGSNRQKIIDDLHNGLTSPERNAADYLTAMKIQDIWAPVKLQIYLTIATVPLIFVTGGMASAATQGIGRALAQVTLNEALKTGAKITVMRWAATNVVLFTIENIIFAGLNRVAFTAAKAAYGVGTGDMSSVSFKGIYDSQKSVSENFTSFGYDVLSGVPYMLCLPVAGMMGKSIGAKLLGQSTKGGATHIGRELGTFIIDSGSNALGMLTVQNAEAWISSSLANDEEVKSMNQQNPYLHATFIGMGFTFIGRNFGHVFSSENPKLPVELLRQIELPGSLPDAI
jgi:hypothetical protein